MDLAEFLTARLDEREALAGKIQQVLDSGWNYRDELGGLIGEIADPAAMLREVGAMRAILAECKPRPGAGIVGIEMAQQRILRHLVAIWSGHPDYRAGEMMGG